MSSASYNIVAESLETIVGDILARGIIKTGLQKVGSDPETTTPDEMKRAIDAHIVNAVKPFMGAEKGLAWASKTKETLDKCTVC